MQNNFDLFFCGYDNRLEEYVKVKQIHGSKMNCVKDLAPMNQREKLYDSICLKGEVYVFGTFSNADNFVKSIEKYSPSTNVWSKVTDMIDKREYFCACAFMDEIYVFGGYYFNKNNYECTVFNSCLQFDTNVKSWNEVSKMKEGRTKSACVVFQGNIVVSGGLSVNGCLNTVESYDAFADKWSSMPNMINSQSDHNLVVVRDRLFVIGYGDNNCEVFNNDCKKFVALKSPNGYIVLNKAMSIGNRVVVFQKFRSIFLLL